MGLKLSSLRDYLRTSLWFVPVLCVVGAAALSAVTLQFDAKHDGGGILVFSGSGESARSVLTAIASSIVTLTALVFSVTIVVLQLASSQYSPRVLRSFLRDRRSQVVLGVFLATFAYTMLVLRAVRGSGGGGGPGGGAAPREFVPEISVNIAYLLTGLSLLFFVVYIHHIAQSMQASSIVAKVAAESASALERLYPTIGEDPPQGKEAVTRPGEGATITAGTSGYLQAVDEEELLEVATKWDVTLRLVPAVGDFVPARSHLFVSSGPVDDAGRADLHRCVTLGRRRTMQQDPMFGFRQLVDVAEKALSPGINDPTTAVEAIDRLHELLLILAERSIPAADRVDDENVVRLVLPRPGWDSFVQLAFDEIRHYGEGSIQVTRRLRAVVEGLVDEVPPPRRQALERQRRLLDRSAERGFDDAEDVEHAREESGHG